MRISLLGNYVLRFIQDPAGIFDLVEVVGNGTYGQVHKVTSSRTCFAISLILTRHILHLSFIFHVSFKFLVH